MDKKDQKAIASLWKLGGLRPRELARLAWLEIYDGDLLTRAAALSYYFLLALFPLLIFLTFVITLGIHRGIVRRVAVLRLLFNGRRPAAWSARASSRAGGNAAA